MFASCFALIMANPGRREKRPPGAVLLPGLARPNLGTSGTGRAAVSRELTAKISYTPPESAIASTVDASEEADGSSLRLRHLTLSRPRIRNRSPSKRARLDPMSASRAPPQFEDPPAVPLTGPPVFAVSDSPPELPSGPPPDLPPSFPPELPPTPPPDLPLPESSHVPGARTVSSGVQSLSTEVLTASAITGDVTPPPVDQYKVVTSSPGSHPAASGLKSLEKYRSSKASGGRRTLTSLSGLSRSGGKSPAAARRLGLFAGKKQVLDSGPPKLESQSRAKTMLSSSSKTAGLPAGTEVGNPPALPVSIPPPLEKERPNHTALAEKSEQLAIGESRMPEVSTNTDEGQTNSAEEGKPSLPLPNSSAALFRSPDIVPVDQPSVQFKSVTREQVGMGSSPLATGFKSKFVRLSEATKGEETASPSIIRNLTANDSKPDVSDKLGIASRVNKSQSSSEDPVSGKDEPLTSSSIPMGSTDKTGETATRTGEHSTFHLSDTRTMSLSRITDYRNKTFPKMKSATEVRDKKLPSKKRFSMASLSALSPSPVTNASVHCLPDSEPHHQLRIPAVSKPPPLNPTASEKSRSLDRRFLLTRSADIESSRSKLPGDLSLSTERHSAPPNSLTNPLVEDSQQLPELPSEPPPEVPEMPLPDLPAELPPELPSDPPPPIPPEFPPPLSDEPKALLDSDKLILDNGHVNGVTGLKSVKVEKQSWTRSLEALKSNPITLSAVADRQTTEMTHTDDMSVEKVPVNAVITVEESGANSVGSHEAPFDYSFLMDSKENKAPSRMSASSGDSDLLTAVFSALKSSSHNPPEEARQDDEEPSASPAYVSELLDDVDRQGDKWKKYPSVIDQDQFRDFDIEEQDPGQNGYRADDVKVLEKTSAKIHAASVRRRNLEANLTDNLAGDLAALQQMQQEQDSRIGDNLVAIEEERRLAKELLQGKLEDEIAGTSSGSDNETPDLKRQLEQETIKEGGSTDDSVEDLRKSVFVHPPALYSGDLPSSDLLNAHELEKAHDSSLPMSFDRIDRCDDNEELDAKLLSNSREKAVELWTTAEVTDWLKDVGLGQYAPNFLDHQVNGEKLLEIDFHLLEEMDIFSPDEREKILAEVYSLSVGSEGDVDSSLEDSLNATGEEEKVKAIAAIEALKSPHGWDASADLRTLEEKAHLTPTITWKGKTASNDIVSDETNPNVGVHPPVADSTRVLKSTRTEPVFSASALPHEETSWKVSTSSLNNDSRFSHAQRLPSKFGVTESCPAIRHAVDQEQQGVVRVWLLALQTGLEYKALRVSTKMSALDVVKHLLEKLDMVDDPLRYYLVEVSGKKGVQDREVANFECPLQLQSHWTSSSKTKFELKIRPSGVVKVTTNVPGCKSEEKAITISSLTSCQEVVQLALRKFNIKDVPDKYCLVENSTSNPEKRVLGDGEYPLMVQSAWTDTKSFHLQVAAPQSRSSGGSDSIFQSPNRVSSSDFPSLPSSGYSLARLSDDIETVRAENASLWVELESLRPKAARVESLEQTVATLQSAYECLQESASQREKHEEDEKARLQQEVGELRATTAKLSARTNGMDNETVTLIQDLEATYSVRVSKLEDSIQMKAERVQQLETENATLRSQQVLTPNDMLQPELLAQRDRQIEYLQENVMSQEIVITELQRENEEMKSNQTQAATNHHHSKLKALEASLSKKDGILAALHAENGRLQLRVQDQDKTIRDLESTANRLQSQLSSGRCSLFSLASTRLVSLVAAELTGLSKQESGLSLADGGSSLSGHQGPGVYIRNVKKGTPAYKVKKLAVGDRILEINGQDLSYCTAADITAVLENAGDCARLIVARDSDYIADGGLNETEVLSLKLRSDALSSQLDAKNVELDQMRQECSRLKTKTAESTSKTPIGEMELLQQTVSTVREQLAESEQSREDLRHTLDELQRSSTSAHQQHRELQEGLQQNIYELQMRLQQVEEYNSRLEDIMREQESNIASLQKAVNEKEEALTFAETEREHAVKLLSERTQDKSTEDIVSASDYNSAAKEELLQMLQEKEIEQRRQKSYMDQLLSLVIEHAPSILGKLHAYEEASLKSEEWC